MKPKQVKKLKKELGNEVNKIKAENRDKIEQASPYYEYTLDRDACCGDIESLLGEEVFESKEVRDRWSKARFDKFIEQVEYAHKQYISLVEEYIFQDYLNQKDVPYQSENYGRAHEELYGVIIRHLSSKGILLAINRLIKLGLLSKLSLSRVIHYVYYCYDWKGEEGKEIADLCFKDIDKQCVLTLLELEIGKIESIKGRTLSDELIYLDSKELKEKLSLGEPFKVYRGFAVDKDEYVRKGFKADGDDYYKYAGDGVSYSLNRNIAILFAFQKLKVSENKYYNSLKQLAPTLISEDMAIEAMTPFIREAMDKQSDIKPVLGEFIVNPKDLRGTHAGRQEAEVNVYPEDLIVKRYTLLSPEELSKGIAYFGFGLANSIEEQEGIYDPDKIVVFSNSKWIANEKDKRIIFANGKDINKAVKEFKSAVKTLSESKDESEGNKNIVLVNNLYMDLAKRFNEYSLEIPDRYLPLNTRNTSLLVRLIKKGVQFARKPFTTYK